MIFTSTGNNMLSPINSFQLDILVEKESAEVWIGREEDSSYWKEITKEIVGSA
jgi:hypothetical protein